MKVETHGLKLLAADLERAQKDIAKQVAKVTGMACNQIKKDVKNRWTGLAHLPHLPRAITYDVTTRATTVTGEVGAEHERLQGKLAWIPEYGSPTSSPQPGFAPASDREVPVWERYLDDAAAEVLGD